MKAAVTRRGEATYGYLQRLEEVYRAPQGL
jgi:hypothetical protein